MATWVTHLMIADALLKRHPQLDRRGFCVGNIAPDCNVENEDWTAFTPPRAVTHWMQGQRKKASDCDAFCQQYILARDPRPAGEEYAFLLGYYAHLIADAEFQRMIRDPDRIHAAWLRLQAVPNIRTEGMEESWDNIKRLIPKDRRMGGIYTLEAEYLREHPDSGFLTEILPLKHFPDYIDYLPRGAIVRKIGVMGFAPEPDPNGDFLAMSREEYAAFLTETVRLVEEKIEIFGLLDAKREDVC